MKRSLLVTIDTIGPLPGSYAVFGRPAEVALERFTAFATEHAARPEEQRYARVILVGDGERLEREGFDFATLARRSGFDHVRLDTSPRRLTEGAQVRAVVLAGVNEFSLGLHAPEAKLHDALTQRPGEFEAVLKALQRLRRHEVRALVDVVVSAANLASLAATVARAIESGAARIALWSHCPQDAAAPGPEIAPFATLVPALAEAVEQCRAAGVEVALRRVPACLLGIHAELLDNSLPDALDGVRPGRPLAEFNCLREAQCELAEPCGGLHHAYVNAHGWELERLAPVPRVRPWKPRDRGVERHAAGLGSPRGHAPWLALLGEHAGRVESVGLTRAEARYPMQMPDGTRFILILTKRDAAVRFFRQSASFNLAYTDVEGPAAERTIANFVEPVLATIIANDDGALSLG